MQEVIKSFCGERGRGVARGEEMKNKLTEVDNGAGPKTMILHSKKGIPSPVVVEVKGIVTLREAVQVPAVPKTEIPPPYKVLAPAW